MAVLPEFKVVLIGHGDVGKKSWLKSLPGYLGIKHLEKFEVDMYQVVFETNLGNVLLNIWYVNGSSFDLFDPDTRTRIFVQAQSAIFMYDVTSRASWRGVRIWHKMMLDENGNIPMVLVGNKVEFKDHKVKYKTVEKFHTSNNMLHVPLSVRCRYNLEKPFHWLIRKLATFALARDDNETLDFFPHSLETLCLWKALDSACTDNVTELLTFGWKAGVGFELHRRLLLDKCFQIVKEHGSELLLDPNFTALEAKEPKLWRRVAEETGMAQGESHTL